MSGSAGIGLRQSPSRRQRVLSSHRFLTLLFGATVALTLGVAVYSFSVDYARTRLDIEQRAQAYAKSMATDVRWYVDVARQSLARAAAQLHFASKEADYSRALSAALSDMPSGVVIVVYDAQGRSQAVLGLAPRPIDVSDRPYFQQLKGGQSFTISNIISDRVTGTKTFAVGLALREHNTFSGAAVAYAPMDVFSDAWLSVGGEDSNAFLVHREGWLTARLPPLNSDIYDGQVSQTFVSQFTGSPTGSYWAAPSPIDGITRVLGFAEVTGTPLIAVIGISPAAAFKAFWIRAGLTAAILLPILLLLGLGTYRMRKLIDDQERTATRLEAALRRNETLLLEIHHRVKNNLQSALSLVRMQVKDPGVMSRIEPRIAAMVAVHEHIYKNDDFVASPARKYITDIARNIIYSSSERIKLHTEIDDVEIPGDMLMPIGQLVSEAIINGVKYGFPDDRAGTIAIRMSVDESGLATLTIHNDGVPMADTPRSGLGSRLMAAFAAQMRGRIETISDSGGVLVRVEFPLQPKPL